MIYVQNLGSKIPITRLNTSQCSLQPRLSWIRSIHVYPVTQPPSGPVAENVRPTQASSQDHHGAHRAFRHVLGPQITISHWGHRVAAEVKPRHQQMPGTKGTQDMTKICIHHGIDGITHDNFYIYIYLYIYRERERIYLCGTHMFLNEYIYI